VIAAARLPGGYINENIVVTTSGGPPIEYLANWRIRLAAERLRVGHESIPNIAASIGYESEAAFNHAFKRITGMTPGSWRDTNTPSNAT
jgi:AraC-like DNA-binding protein